ncbi:DUF1499 domain-containing protein [Leptolyngbya sp. FACHB-261]|uniref:DUF1499 domain-containing protein n=1 Tax=Leptolyngbya sp. FACHB-261 TaxID=2692806 RepID=UPI0016846670|nr:DUF1499 domain-containing protein [Leptolyngbya sp. FACHB-261]MBD2102048.1 DUF1499 domain-containing protein [Leptolyngbya sp. FACHB-261]
MFAGTRPTYIGVREGKLAACPDSPNCVCSQASAQDKEHSIAPFPYTSSPEQAMAAVKAAVQSVPRAKVVTERKNYLYAEFTSALLGFVDDVEFYVDETEKVIHVRSASRLGKSDLGVNRTRVEAIRAKLKDLATSP